MDKNKILPSVVCGFAVSAVSVIPGIDQGITCCMIVPLASVSAVMLYQKVNRTPLPFKITAAVGTGLLTGLFAGFFATLFDVILSFITHTNEFIEALPYSLPELDTIFKQFNLPKQLYDELSGNMRAIAADIKANGFSAAYTGSMLFSNLLINSIFGIIGGLLGVLFVNRREKQ